MNAESMRLHWEWPETDVSPTDDGLKATLALFSIQIGASVVTRHARRDAVGSTLFIPLAPLAAWFARSWHELMNDAHPFGAALTPDLHDMAAQTSEEEWEDHEDAIVAWTNSHALRFVGDGVHLPDLRFLRMGNHILASWRARRIGDDLTFITEGRAVLPLPDFCAEVRRFVRTTLDRVQMADARSAVRTDLEAVANSVLDPWTDPSLRLVASRLGVSSAAVVAIASKCPDRASVQAALADHYLVPRELMSEPEELDSPFAAAARGASGRMTEADRESLLRLAVATQRAPEASNLTQLRFAVRDVRPATAFPTARDGYECAAVVRRKLRMGNRPCDIEKVLRTLGCVIQECVLVAPDIDGLALWTVTQRAMVVVNTGSLRAATPWGRRALLAHELYHLLFDVADRRCFGEATRSGVPTASEPAANGFAAELLLPLATLPVRASLDHDAIARLRDELVAKCSQFGVGWELAVRQMQNRRKLDRAAVDVLLNTAEGLK